MHVIVCGATGLVGRVLCKLLSSACISFTGTYNKTILENGRFINFGSQDDIRDNFSKVNPTICINCIAERNVDKCEDNWMETKRINCDIVENIATVCEEKGIHLIHISTDYVFDGKSPPYYPSSQSCPLQNYGISKCMAEQVVTNILGINKCTVVRVPVLFTHSIKSLNETAVTVIGRKILNQVHSCSEDNFNTRRPVFIDDFCEFLIKVINNKICGIIHYYSSNKMTKYEILKEIAGILNKRYDHVVPDSNCVADAKRPRDTQLLDDRVDASLYTQTDFRTALRMCFDKYIHPPIISQSATNESMFLMFDLDGTLVATDQVHYRCYVNALSPYGIDLKWDDFDKYINTCVFDEVLKEKYHLTNSDIRTIKAHKNNLMKDEDMFLVKGAEALIHHIHARNINTVVVTNTSREIVDLFKQKLPILNELKQWVCREDYTKPKPNSECYEVAMNSYYKNEKYIIGFENTMNGYNAIKEVARHVYIVTDKTRYCYSQIVVDDVNIVSDFERI